MIVNMIAVEAQTVSSGEDEHAGWPTGEAFQVQTGLGFVAGEEPSQEHWPLASAGEEGFGVAVSVIQGSARSRPVLRMDRWTEKA